MEEKDKRSAQLVMVTGFLVLYFIFKWQPMLYIALAIGIGSLVSSKLGDLIVRGWFGLAHILGWINTRILLTIIYYFFLLPVALISRIGKKDTLNLKKRERSTLFVQRDHLYTKKDLENTW